MVGIVMVPPPFQSMKGWTLTNVLLLRAQEETAKLAQFTDYRMVSVVGGQSIEEQGFKLRKVRPPPSCRCALPHA